jgi:hypothetical protein
VDAAKPLQEMDLPAAARLRAGPHLRVSCHTTTDIRKLGALLFRTSGRPIPEFPVVVSADVFLLLMIPGLGR